MLLRAGIKLWGLPMIISGCCSFLGLEQVIGMLKSLCSVLSREKVSSEPACPSLVQDAHSPVSQAAPSSSAELIWVKRGLLLSDEDFYLLHELSWLLFGMFVCDHKATRQQPWLGSFLVNFGGIGVSCLQVPIRQPVSVWVFVHAFLQLSVL